MQELDRQYSGDGNGLLQTLCTQGVLKKVEGQDSVYRTTQALPPSEDKVRYFVCDETDNKIYEVYKETKTEDGNQVTEFVRKEGATPVSAEEIGAFNKTAERVTKLYNDKALEFATEDISNPVFQASGAKNEKYIIKNGKLYHIQNVSRVYKSKDDSDVLHVTVDFTDGRTGVYLENLSDSDLDLCEDTEIKTKQQALEEQRKLQRSDVTKVESRQYASLGDIDNEEMDKISEDICGEKNHFRKSKYIPGYFISNKPKGRIYKYDAKTGKLKYAENIKTITEYGFGKDYNNNFFSIAEVFMDKNYNGAELVNKIQEYGAEFRKHLNGRTSQKNVILSHRKLNTIIAINDPLYTINFIKGYKNQGGFWSYDDMCRQIVTEHDFETKVGSTTIDGSYYVKQIANLILQVVDITDFDKNSDDYANLCKIANGETMSGIAAVLDKIINKVIDAYDKKYGVQ